MIQHQKQYFHPDRSEALLCHPDRSDASLCHPKLSEKLLCHPDRSEALLCHFERSEAQPRNLSYSSRRFLRSLRSVGMTVNRGNCRHCHPGHTTVISSGGQSPFYVISSGAKRSREICKTIVPSKAKG